MSKLGKLQILIDKTDQQGFLLRATDLNTQKSDFSGS